MAKYAAIRAISTYLPETVEKNELSEKRLEKLGIYERHISTAKEAASDLAVKAAENLFCEYDIKKEDIDYLIVCVTHPDYPTPPTACIAQDKLGLLRQTAAIDISMGCSGYPYGLSIAKGLVESQIAKNVLYLNTNVMTKFINKKDNNIRPIFGDGATATYINAVEADHPLIHSFAFDTDGSGYDVIGVRAGGSRNTCLDTEKVVEQDERGNIRTNFEWHMNGNELFVFTLKTVPPLVERVLNKATLKREDIDYYVFHQANHYMLNNIQKKCHIENMAFFNDMRNTGNTGCCSIPLGIAKILETTSFKDLQRVMMVGFGVGLSCSACIADLTNMIKKSSKSPK